MHRINLYMISHESYQNRVQNLCTWFNGITCVNIVMIQFCVKIDISTLRSVKCRERLGSSM